MKTRRWTLFAGIAMLALPLLAGANAPQKSQPKPPKSTLSRDEAAILAAEEASMEVIRKRDVDGYMKYYAHRDDLTVYDTDEAEVIVGWDACRKHWEQQFAGIRSIDKLELSKVRVHASGDMGFVTAAWSLDVTTNEGEKASQSGRMTDIFQKIDGKWLIIHEHNSILNGNAADADRPQAGGDTVRYTKPERR